MTEQLSPTGNPWNQFNIYGEVYCRKDLGKRCVLRLEWTREEVIDGESGDDERVDSTCGEKVKDWDVDEAHEKIQEVDSKVVAYQLQGGSK